MRPRGRRGTWRGRRAPGAWTGRSAALMLASSHTQIVLHLLTGAVPVLSGVVIVLLWAWLNYVMIVRLPYLGQGQSKARAFAMGAIGCAFLASTVQVGGVNAAAILLIPISVVGGTLAILGARKRIVRAEAVLEKFKEIRKNLSQTDLRVHKFFDHEDPEVGRRAG